MRLGTGGDADLFSQVEELVRTLRDNRLDQAEAIYLGLCESFPAVHEMLVFPVLIAIQRGQALEALRLVDDQPPGRCPELRALCLKVLGDPRWQGEATALLDSSDPAVARSMRELLSLAPAPPT